MKKLVLSVFFALVSLAISLSVFAEKKILRFATEASYPPFEFMSAHNEIEGFDIDLAKALCQKMQIECVFVNQAFDSLIPSLKSRRIDAVIAGLDITPERSKQVAFTTPYFKNSALFIIQTGKFAGIDDLKGKRVGMQNGSTHQKFLIDKHPEMIPISYSTYQNAILDLKNGRLDAVFGDTAAVNQWLIKNPTLGALGNKITDSDYFGVGLGIAVKQADDSLLNKLNEAIKQIKQDGSYDRIYKKWFPKS